MPDDTAQPSAATEQSAAQTPQQPNSQADPPALLSRITRGIVHKPPRIFVYGVHGIGKSTFAASAPDPIMICTEEGAEEIDVPKFPRAQSSEDVLDALRALYKEKHEYKTVVIDTADWLEDFIQDEVEQKYSQQDRSYGKDSQLAAKRASDILHALTALRDRRTMAVIIVAHSEIKRFDSPMSEPFDRYQPKLQRALGSLMQEWADAVLFATFDITVKREDVGFNKNVRRGISSGDRIVYTEERPAFLAKNRYGMPPELELDWAKVAERIPYYQTSK